MGECVKTTFNGIYQNDNLKKFGVLRLKSESVSDSTTNNRKLSINVSEQCTMSIVEDGYYFQDTQSSSKVKTAIIPANTNKTYVFDDGNYTIEIENKYAIKSFSTTEGNWSCLCVEDIEDMEFSSSLERIMNKRNSAGGSRGSINKLSALPLHTLFLNKSRVSGDIASLQSMFFYSLSLEDTGVTGDIANIHCLSTYNSTINLANTNVYGTLESFVESNKGLIGTSISSTVSVGETNVTFHNNAVQSGNYTITFGSSVTVSYGGNVIGTYDGTSWTYNN